MKPARLYRRIRIGISRDFRSGIRFRFELKAPPGWLSGGFLAQCLRLRDRHACNCVSLFDRIDDILAGLVLHLAENGVFAVEPIGGDVRNEELAAVCVRAGVGHGKGANFVLAGIVPRLVGKSVAGAAGSSTGWIAALD